MRVRSLALRIIRQFFHDKRTIALMMIAPLLILWFVSLIFNGNTYEPKIGVVDVPKSVEQSLGSAGGTVTEYGTISGAKSALFDNKVDATIWKNGRTLDVTLEGSDPNKSKSTLLVLQKAVQSVAGADVQKATESASPIPAPTIHYLYGNSAMSQFDNFGPVLIGVFAFFFVFIIAGIAFLKERTSGTLDRLLATPLRRWEIVVGYVIGFGIFTTIQACLITWFAVDVLGMMMVGNFFYLLLVTLLLSMTALTLGTFLSAFANSEFQMMQFIPIVILPQVFFSGLFSIDNMAPWIQGFSKITPLYYGADALKNVMIRGKGFSDIATDLLVLLVLSLCFMTLNTLALRKYRKV